MRRILAIILLAVILVVALSVPALAKPSDPPNAFGQDNAWLVKLVKNSGYSYGRDYNAPIRWAIWWGGTPWDNGGEYVAYMKDYASH